MFPLAVFAIATLVATGIAQNINIPELPICAAITANVKLCASANVTIPNYLGCSPDLASKFTASAATATRSSASNPNNAASSFTGTLQSAVSLPTNVPIATFAGSAIFTGSCTSPEYAMVTMDGGGILEYPWAGCSNDRPNCCPFDIKVGGLLTVCPRDYTTTSNACCPS
ncbi:MAG: hypothetical protein Q9196_005841 [Gyalolechia fulgens]